MGALPQNKNIHYEVLGLKNTSWSIIKIEADEGKALKLAEEKWAAGAFKAVKVMRERLNPKDGSYRTSQVCIKGKDIKKKTRKSSSTACWKPADISSYEGRRTITQMLMPDLETWQITAIELTNVPDHYYRLDNTGVLLQNAVQKAAIQQVKGSDTSIQDRMKELYSLIEVAITQLKELYDNDKKIPRMSNLGFEKVISELEKKENRAHLLTLSIVQLFLDKKTILDKLTAILDMVKPDHPSWVHTTTDCIIAELISSPSSFRHMLGEFGGLGNTLITYAQMAHGAAKPEKPSKEISALNSLLELDRLRQTKLAIFGRIASELKGRQPLTKEGALGDLRSVDTIIKTLRGSETGKINDFRLIDAIDERCERTLSQQGIGEYLINKKTAEDQLMALLNLVPYVQGESAKRKLCNYFMPIITSSEHDNIFRTIEGNYLERLKTISRIQRSIIQAKLPEDYKNKLVDKLDEYCLNIMSAKQILPRLRKDTEGPVKAGRKLLQMLAGGYFTVGQSSSKARAEARIYMKLPNFIDKNITGISDEARAKSLMELQQLLTKSGMTKRKS
jgi:hypothetical protein